LVDEGTLITSNSTCDNGKANSFLLELEVDENDMVCIGQKAIVTLDSYKERF
jgi:hypothetical protein